jgi:ABC-type uncharacterized transport system substrate-binding protein
MGSTVVTECLSEYMTALKSLSYELVTTNWRLIAEVLGLGQVAQKATTTIPIIIVGGGSLAQNVPSLAQPGGNVTGFANFGPDTWSPG